jgi:hypothetical protein
VHGVAVADPAQEDVGRLEIAVQDPVPVRFRQRGHRLRCHRRQLRPQDRAAPDARGQVLPFQELHHIEGSAAGQRIPVDDGDDVRVVEPRDDLRLAAEARQRVWPRRGRRAQGLEREAPPDARVLDLEQDPHPAGRDRPDHPVAIPQHLSDELGHGRPPV